MHDPFDRTALQAFGEIMAEDFIEVGPDNAFGRRSRERVTRAALGDELLLADDQVGVVVALDSASARAQQHAARADEQAERAQASGGGE